MSSSECSKASEQLDGEKKSSEPIQAQATESDPSHSSASTSRTQRNTYEKLQNATEKAVTRLTSKTKVMPYIKEHFRKCYTADGKYFLEVYKSMMDQLRMMILDELKLQFEVGDVQQLLADLEKTVQENPSTDRTWRPSGNPKDDIKAHLEKSTREEVHQLEKILASLKCQNKLLNAHVARTDQKLEQSIKTLQSHQQAWQKATSMMTEETRQALIDSDSDLDRGTRHMLERNGKQSDSSLQLKQSIKALQSHGVTF